MPSFMRNRIDVVSSASTLLLTDAPVLEENSGKQMTVLGAGIPG